MHIIENISYFYVCIYTYDIKSKSLKIKVFSISNPQAMMSLAFSNAMWLACSRVRSFHRYFSSSVSCMTSGTSKVSCNHLWTSSKFTVSLRYHSLYTSSYTMVLSKQHVPDFEKDFTVILAYTFIKHSMKHIFLITSLHIFESCSSVFAISYRNSLLQNYCIVDTLNQMFCLIQYLIKLDTSSTDNLTHSLTICSTQLLWY